MDFCGGFFSSEENLEMYNNQQQQRAYERAVRKSKRELAGIDAARQATTDPALKAKLDKEFERKSVTLKNREDRLKQWCADKGLALDSSRVRTVGFGRSVSQKAVWAAKRNQVQNMSLNLLDNSGGNGIIKVINDIILFKQLTVERLKSKPYNCLPDQYRRDFEYILNNNSHWVAQNIIREMIKKVHIIVDNSSGNSLYNGFFDYILLNTNRHPSVLAHELFHRYDVTNKFTEKISIKNALRSDYDYLLAISHNNIIGYLKKTILMLLRIPVMVMFYILNLEVFLIYLVVCPKIK